MTGDSALFVTDDEGRYLAANDSALDASRLHPRGAPAINARDVPSSSDEETPRSYAMLKRMHSVQGTGAFRRKDGVVGSIDPSRRAIGRRAAGRRRDHVADRHVRQLEPRAAAASSTASSGRRGGRTRLPGVDARLPARERGPGGVRLVRPRDEKEHLVGARSSIGSVSVMRSTNGSSFASAPTALRSCSSSVGSSGIERRDMPVGPEPEQHEVEPLERAELLLVKPRAFVAAELAAHPVHRPGAHVVEERRLRHPVVRALVALGNAALVAPPELDVRPVALEARPRARTRRAGVEPPVRTT